MLLNGVIVLEQIQSALDKVLIPNGDNLRLSYIEHRRQLTHFFGIPSPNTASHRGQYPVYSVLNTVQ
jgi:hypothetical protein